MHTNRNGETLRTVVWLLVLVAVALGVGFLVSARPQQPTVAFIGGGADKFWEVAAAGAQAAADQYGAEVLVRLPSEGQKDQNSYIDEMLDAGVTGIAISPVNPPEQSGLLGRAADQVHLITHDSDAPLSRRLCYIGADNYRAGRLCGELIKQALPEGGELVISIGSVDQDNGRLRRQGLIDELLDRPFDPDGSDPLDEVVKGERFTVLATLTDQHDQKLARENIDKALADNAGLDAVVAMFGYSGPICLAAIEEAGKLEQVRIVAFDEHPDVLAGIERGAVHATVVQDPFNYGFQSVRMLTCLARGERVELPVTDSIYFPCVAVTKDRLDAFREKMKDRLSAANRE